MRRAASRRPGWQLENLVRSFGSEVLIFPALGFSDPRVQPDKGKAWQKEGVPVLSSLELEETEPATRHNFLEP